MTTRIRVCTRGIAEGALVAAMMLAGPGCEEGGGDGDGQTDAVDEDGDEGEGNAAPEITSTPGPTAEVYAWFEYEVVCADPDGDDVTIAPGEADTCGAAITDGGDGTAVYAFEPGEAMAEGDCTLAVVCSDGELEATQEQDVHVGPVREVGDLAFGDLETWAEPIDDYIEENETILGHAEFMKDIFDMAAFDGRLWIGYGDADLNLGRNTPIELRYWAVEEPDAVTSDFATDEEQVSRFRVTPELMMVPGIDATEDGFLGNAYTLEPGGECVKSRTLELAWHVHDMILFGSTIYACGSGGTEDDYTSSTVNALLYRSDDGGETFTTQVLRPHPAPPGDHRFVHMLSITGHLYVCGYYSSDGTTYATNWEVVGSALMPWGDLSSLFVMDSYDLSADVGLLSGVVIGTELTMGLRVVTAAGAEEMAGFTGTLVNAEPMLDGTALVLFHDGDAYPVPEAGPWDWHVAITDGTDLDVIVSQTTDTKPTSVAFWRRSLFVGMQDGTVWRSVGE